MATEDNDVLNHKIAEPEEFLEFKFGKEDDPWEGQSVVKVWCDGREYDASTEAYHPVYSYSIVTPKFDYTSNDIHGGANFTPDLNDGAQSLMAFLYACQEGMPAATTTEDGLTAYIETENSDLFPEQVREWAYHYAEDIGMVSVQLQAESAISNE